MDEKLAEMVRKFPALYNKTVKEFKDKNVTNLIWSKFSKELMMQSGKNLAYFVLLLQCPVLYIKITVVFLGLDQSEG